MASILEAGEHHHLKVLKANAGIKVFYKRGKEAAEIVVVPGRGSNDSIRFRETNMEDESKSFILGVTDLHNFFPPQKNDVIQIKATGERYQIKPNESGACHVESGNYNVMIRVHAIRK